MSAEIILRFILGYVFFVDSTYREASSKCRKEDILDTYIIMRKRFATYFKDVVDFGLGRNRDPRCLRISSVLLMEASRDVLDEFVKNIDCHLKSAAVNIQGRSVTPDKYNKFIQSVSNIAAVLNNFFQVEPSANEDVGTIVEVLKTLLSVLEKISKISGLLVNQNGHQYWLFSDERIKKTTLDFLHALEIRDMNSGLKNELVLNALKEDGSQNIPRDISKAFKNILLNIKDAEKDTKRKERVRGNKIPTIDASKEYKVMQYKAASEEDVA